MTKFYLLAAATLTCGVANAALNINSEKIDAAKVKAETGVNSITAEEVASRMSVRQLDDTDEYNDEEWEDLGLGTMTDAWILASFGSQFYATLSVNIQENKSTPGLYRLVDVYGYDTLYGNGYGYFSNYNSNKKRVDIIVDATDPDYVTILPQYSGWTFPDGVCTDGNGNPVTDLFICSGNVKYETEFTKEQIKEQHKWIVNHMEGDVITIACAAYGPTLEEPYASWNIDDFGNPLPVVITLPDNSGGYEPDPENWIDMGTCMFTDGYFTNTVREEYWGMTYEVPYQQNVHNKGIFRFPKPFFQPNSDLMLSYPTHRFDKIYDYFVVDASTPDVVFVEPYNSQMYFFEDDLMYATNINYHYTVKLGSTRSQVVDYMRKNWTMVNANNMQSTYKDGVITINQSIFITDAMPDSYLPISTNIPTVIDFTNNAVNVAGADDTEAEPEYFNLQGIRITSPEPGRIVIKRQGGKATKIMMN